MYGISLLRRPWNGHRKRDSGKKVDKNLIKVSRKCCATIRKVFSDLLRRFLIVFHGQISLFHKQFSTVVLHFTFSFGWKIGIFTEQKHFSGLEFTHFMSFSNDFAQLWWPSKLFRRHLWENHFAIHRQYVGPYFTASRSIIFFPLPLRLASVSAFMHIFSSSGTCRVNKIKAPLPPKFYILSDWRRSSWRWGENIRLRQV